MSWTARVFLASVLSLCASHAAQSQSRATEGVLFRSSNWEIGLDDQPGDFDAVLGRDGLFLESNFQTTLPSVWMPPAERRWSYGGVTKLPLFALVVIVLH